MGPRRFSLRRRGDAGAKAGANRQRAASAASEKSYIPPGNTEGLNGGTLNEKQAEDHSTNIAREPSLSISTMGRNASILAIEDAIAEDRAAHRIVRTVPGWVRDADEDDVEWGRLAGLLPASPQAATVAQHNHTPSNRANRIYDHGRSAHPYAPVDGQQQTSRWVTFARASAYPREPDEGERVSAEWLNQNFGDYSTPWLAGQDEEDGEDSGSRYHAFRRKRKVWYKRAQDTILKNPLIPLAFRLTVFIFSAVALSLGGSIHHFSDKLHLSQGPSAEMAIIVDVIAMVYTVYITVDEYISKPLGLRSVRAKLRLIFLDLIFIVFQAANLSLAFESLSDTGEACTSGSGTGKGQKVTSTGTCNRQKALASVLFIALIAWLMTFAVSVLRLVERVAQS